MNINSSGSRNQLLLVEENPYLATILVQTLKTDFEITLASTGKEAVHLLMQGTCFDAVVTELDLTHFSGIQLINLIRTSNLNCQMPVVVLSSATDSETRINCLLEGADSYIAKPFNPLEVKAKLQAIFRRTVSQPELAETAYTSVHSLQREDRKVWQTGSRILSLIRGSI